MGNMRMCHQIVVQLYYSYVVSGCWIHFIMGSIGYKHALSGVCEACRWSGGLPRITSARTFDHTGGTSNFQTGISTKGRWSLYENKL